MLTRAVPRSGPGACLPRTSPRCRLATIEPLGAHNVCGLATAAVACSAGTWLGATLLERDRRSPRYLTPRVRSVRFQTSADSPPVNFSTLSPHTVMLFLVHHSSRVDVPGQQAARGLPPDRR